MRVTAARTGWPMHRASRGLGQDKAWGRVAVLATRSEVKRRKSKVQRASQPASQQRASKQAEVERRLRSPGQGPSGEAVARPASGAWCDLIPHTLRFCLVADYAAQASSLDPPVPAKTLCMHARQRRTRCLGVDAAAAPSQCGLALAALSDDGG